MLTLGEFEIGPASAALVVGVLLAAAVLIVQGAGDAQGHAALVARWGFVGWGAGWGDAHRALIAPWIATSFVDVLTTVFFLAAFAPAVERRFGALGLLAVVLLGQAAALSLSGASPDRPVVGMAGPVAALIAAAAVLHPFGHVRVLVALFLVGIYQVPVIGMVGVAFVRDLWLASRDAAHPGLLAWTGAYGVGVVLGFLLLATGFFGRTHDDLLGVLRHRARRAELREAARTFEQARQRVGAEAPSRHDDATLSIRAAVAEAMAHDRLDEALAAFRSFVARVGTGEGRLCLSRRTHTALGGALYVAGRHAEAAEVYERFLLDHPRDAEAPHVRLLVALLCERSLGNPARARQLADGLEPLLRDDDDRSLLLELSRRLDAAAPSKPAAPPTNAPR